MEGEQEAQLRAAVTSQAVWQPNGVDGGGAVPPEVTGGMGPCPVVTLAHQGLAAEASSREKG